MAWSTIRKATEEDHQRLEKAALRFIRNHGNNSDYVENYSQALMAVDDITQRHYDEWRYENKSEANRLRRLWKSAAARALRHPDAEGIAWDTVGFHVG